MTPARKALVEAIGWRQIQNGIRTGMWRYSDGNRSCLLADGSEPDETICKMLNLPPEGDTYDLRTTEGIRRAQGEQIILRCRERDLRFEQQALEAERAGDTEGCWFAMACRAENKRFWDKVQSDLDAMTSP